MKAKAQFFNFGLPVVTGVVVILFMLASPLGVELDNDKVKLIIAGRC